MLTMIISFYVIAKAYLTKNFIYHNYVFFKVNYANNMNIFWIYFIYLKKIQILIEILCLVGIDIKIVQKTSFNFHFFCLFPPPSRSHGRIW